MLKVKKIITGPIDVNCYIIYDSDSLKCLIVDPGEEGQKVISEIEKGNFKPELLINTHGHYDHIWSDDEIREKYNIPLAIGKDDADMIADPVMNGSALFSNPVSVKKPEILLNDGDEIKCSFTKFKVLSAPGHSIGGIFLVFDGFVITGDTLFAGTIGRTDFPGGDYEQLIQALEKIKALDPKTIVYPGHGPQTTVANELRHNPYLR